jgi:peptide chain release factor 1
LDQRKSEIGLYAVTIEIIGEDLENLINEAGGFRYQRTPPTEKKGRVHTSTVTVSVLEFLEKPKIEWNDKDFKVEWYSGTGKGGQHKNKHQNSARIIHIPTGIISTAQTRSRENSLKEAKESILKKLNDSAISSHNAEQSKIKKDQVGSGMRGDKVRTFMEQHGIVKDHRTNKSVSFDKIMAGNFDLLW